MIKRLLTVFAALSLLSAPVFAKENGNGMVWQFSDADSTVYLVGSIHLLRQGDYPLPASVEMAYDNAQSLVMELDMDDLDASAMASLFTLGMLSDGSTLRSLIGDDDFAEAKRLADRININLERMMSVKPWLAAMTIEQMIMAQNGFDPNLGVEMYFMQRAVSDGKRIDGLETMAQQLNMLDSLGAQDQEDMLMMSLREAADMAAEIDKFIDAWQNGDTDYFVDEALAEMATHENVYEAMLLARNRAWIAPIIALLDGDKNVTVIVGAAHLVGEGSVPALLEKEGVKVKRVN